MGETEKQRVVFLSAVMCTGTLKTHTRARVLQVPGVRWYMVCVYYTRLQHTVQTIPSAEESLIPMPEWDTRPLHPEDFFN